MQLKKLDNKFGHQRIVIEEVHPEIDCGNFPIKRCINETITVDAKIFAEGHDDLGAAIKYRSEKSTHWQIEPLTALGNDSWQGSFKVTEIGWYYYTIIAWVDYFHSWRRNLMRWHEAKQDITVELLIGAKLVNSTIKEAKNSHAKRLVFFANQLQSPDKEQAYQHALEDELAKIMAEYPSQENIAHYPKELKVFVDRERAGFSSWYEIFPRSLGKKNQHGTFKELIGQLPYLADMGFDIIYLPPIHPIGQTFRKGKNNNPQAQPDEPGSPWAIGAKEGGHNAIHPQLGTLEDFKALITKTKEYNLEIALDLAIQCTPDHPYVKQHPQWFKKRPDGSIQYAENPPKKYQDIYPINFQSEQWRELWEEWKQVVLFWIKQGVRIFRVDNPHTKPFIFWEWLIKEIKNNYPEVIFLSEAFTRPSVMYYLAKIGFTQSYTYFTWRNSKQEIIDYLTELTRSPLRDYFRPNFWPNTPDILHEYLQAGGKPAFIIRLVLAATMAANYGIYGPAYELCINTPREEGSEEYLNSEKYEVKSWEINQDESLYGLIKTINRVRRHNRCLQDNTSLQFHFVDNQQLICYSKYHSPLNNLIVVVVNLDPHHTQSGFLELPIHLFGIESHDNYCMHDLLSEEKYLWRGRRNYVELNPHKMPAHIFQVSRIVPHEQDFVEYQ